MGRGLVARGFIPWRGKVMPRNVELTVGPAASAENTGGQATSGTAQRRFRCFATSVERGQARFNQNQATAGLHKTARLC